MIDERRLWLAVLEQAIIDLTNATDAHLASVRAFDTSPSCGSVRSITIPVHFSGYATPVMASASSIAMIDATQPSNRPQFWHGKKNGSQEPFGVYDPKISAKSIAGKLAIGSVTP